MTHGFLGTLIALERAVALDRAWGYLAPLTAGLGALTLVAGALAVSAVLVTIAGALYVALYVTFDRIERTLHTSVQAVGAVAWLAGAILLLSGRPVPTLVPWLAAFLVLTIVGERLELSRLGRPSAGARRTFLAAFGLFSGGVVATLLAPDLGTRIAGIGLVALALWLARYDIARRTVRMRGVTRFVALSLLTGYVWLGVAGAFWLVHGSAMGGSAYDAMLHALFLGFVISMVFGHASVILPSVLRTPLPYRPRFYAHLALLHVGLLLRIVEGDILGHRLAWQIGGVLGVIALLVFIVSSAVAVLEGRRSMPPSAADVQRRRMTEAPAEGTPVTTP